MGILKNEINYNSLINNLSACCLTESKCEHCKKKDCLIGYSRISIASCLNNKVTYVMDGYKNIPLIDTKIYSREELIIGIADILHQCRSCRENHFENCIINILRSCYEILLFGEPIKYKGSSLVYLGDVEKNNKDLTKKLHNFYKSMYK